MKYTMNFGRLATQSPKRKLPGDALRIAVLGDFSGRANARKVEAGESLAAREPRLVDVDNFEATFRQWNATLRLPVGREGSAVEVRIESLDDFHPDQLYSKLRYLPRTRRTSPPPQKHLNFRSRSEAKCSHGPASQFARRLPHR